MAVEILLVRTLRGLEGADDDAREKLKAWKIGQPLKVNVVVPRDGDADLARLRWWWKLCEIVSDNSEYWPTKESASDSLKMGIGIFETFIEKNERGNWEEKRKPGSIALNSKAMAEDKFRAFCVSAQNYVCTDMLIGAHVEDLARELDRYLNPDSRRAA